MAKAETEVSSHYDGVATVSFYPKAHFYKVDDPEHPDGPLVGERMGGATSLTGTMGKGQGLMMWPMYESTKYLRQYFKNTTVEEFCNNDLTLEDIFKEANRAHTKKSDLGKSVGTDAHAWVEEALAGIQSGEKDFPEIPEVEEIALTLRSSYISIINTLKPNSVEDFRKLPKLIMQDIDIQEAIWTEATMINKSITAAKQWFERHKLKVYGVESNVYSRKLRICGRYDSDLEVTCTKDCGWCYRNGQDLPEEDFTGRYITDFKSTNEGSEAPKGIYKEYLAQCGIYAEGILEEFPDRKYDGVLILNGSKNNGTFNTHFGFNLPMYREWANTLANLKNYMYQGDREMKESK